VYFCNKSVRSGVEKERVSSDHIFSALDDALPVFGKPPLTVLCTAFHAEDSWVIFGGTSAGSVVVWDMRRPGKAVEQHALHDGPVLALTVAGSHVTGFELLSSGSDGCVRRSRLRGSASSYGARGAPGGDAYLETTPALRPVAADAPLNGCAYLTSERQRREGRGDGFVCAASAAGVVEWAVVWR
jgi:WD40 repeat protein